MLLYTMVFDNLFMCSSDLKWVSFLWHTLKLQGELFQQF